MTDRSPSSHPGPDPLDTATQWLKLHEDDECSIHPIHRSTVAGLVALASADTLPPAVRRTATEVAREERDEALSLLRELTEPTPCRLDHNGFCQEHLSGSPCAHRRANELLARLDPGEAG